MGVDVSATFLSLPLFLTLQFVEPLFLLSKLEIMGTAALAQILH